MPKKTVFKELKTTTTLLISRQDLIDAFNLPLPCRITIELERYEEDEIEIDRDRPIKVTYSETSVSEE